MKRYISDKNQGRSCRALKNGALLLGMGLVSLTLIACDFLNTELTTWELSGEATYTIETDLSGKTVQMAAFYFDGGAGRLTASKPMVSNCVEVSNSEPEFTLAIDTSLLHPGDGDRIILYMWIETDADAHSDAYDDTELKCIVVNSVSDPVFAADSYAEFIYCEDRTGKDDGWYFNSPAGLQGVGDLRGAKLENEIYFPS